MKTFKPIAAFVAVALFVLAGGSAQATMIWGPATTISGETDAITAGNLVAAYHLGSRPGTFVINGIPFASGNFATTGFSMSWGSTAGAFGSAAAPFTSVTGTGYTNMLSDADYLATSDTSTNYLTLTGLTVGNDYLFQWWSNDSRAGRSGWSTSAVDGNTVAINPNVLGVEGGVGQYAIGSFTAFSSTETIGFFGGTLVMQVNGFQLRDLGNPEPSTVALLGLGALVVWRKKFTA